MFEFDSISTNVVIHDFTSDLFAESHMLFLNFACMKRYTRLLSSLLKFQKKISGETFLQWTNAALK